MILGPVPHPHRPFRRLAQHGDAIAEPPPGRGSSLSLAMTLARDLVGVALKSYKHSKVYSLMKCIVYHL